MAGAYQRNYYISMNKTFLNPAILYKYCYSNQI
jgi:hypothetical protein